MPNLRLDRWYTVIVMLGAAALSGCSSTLTMPDTRPAPGSAEPVAAPSTNARRPLQASPGSEMTRVVDTALEMVGTPYRYGGSTPAGFDCSGLVHYSYARAGIEGLPRTASALEDHAHPIALDELRPADLLFFRLDGRKAQHVGIYTGAGQFIHAPSGGRQVERVSFEHHYWRDRLDRAGRLLP